MVYHCGKMTTKDWKATLLIDARNCSFNNAIFYTILKTNELILLKVKL